jgi:hypothetical protein
MTHTHIEDSPSQWLKANLFLFYALTAFLVAVIYLPVVLEDIDIYLTVSGPNHGCCGFVSENRLARPVTYALVDSWTEPKWTVNATLTERWLTSDGLIDGQAKFWRILERQPVAESP